MEKHATSEDPAHRLSTMNFDEITYEIRASGDSARHFHAFPHGTVAFRNRVACGWTPDRNFATIVLK